MNEWEWRLLEEKTPLEHIRVFETDLRPGDRVRLRPRKEGTFSTVSSQAEPAPSSPSSRTMKTESICRLFWMMIREEIWACCDSRAIDSSFLLKRSNRSGLKKSKGPTGNTRSYAQCAWLAWSQARVPVCRSICNLGDAKAVQRGGADKIFINTSRVGVIGSPVRISASQARVGDKVIPNGPIGDHGNY